MKVEASKELFEIFQAIIGENKTAAEWAEIEADDMFQSKHYRGGFDATETAFCFSFYADTGQEFWFQLTLDEIRQAVYQNLTEVEMRPAK